MSFTPSQREAIESNGNTVVSAGAGAGKTRTLVERCIEKIRCSPKPGALKRMLVVTFTEAAAAEARQRIRHELESNHNRHPQDARWEQELAVMDSAHIRTIHSFCFSLVRENFFELGLDPGISVLDQDEAAIRSSKVLDELLEEHCSEDSDHNLESKAVKELLWEKFRGWADPLRDILRELHEFTQTRPNPAKWYEEQIDLLEGKNCAHWRRWHEEFKSMWRREWEEYLRSLPAENGNAHACADILKNGSNSDGENIFQELAVREDKQFWDGKKTKLLKSFGKFFEEAKFLASLEPSEQCADPLGEDWELSRKTALVLLKLGRQFSERYMKEKRATGKIDFHDLEQLSLKLLTGKTDNQPTELALELQGRFDHIFVDEYQDINHAQDLIIRSLTQRGGNGNAFLVGDVKQSIYGFRQAAPDIFQGYSENPAQWKAISLQDNFRSSESILAFINPFFGWLMRKQIGGVDYDQKAELKFGNAEGRKEMRARSGAGPEVELHLIIKSKANATDSIESGEESESAETGAVLELANAEKEARQVACRLKELKENGFEIFDEKEKKKRAVNWKDMVVLLRSARNKAETYAKTFDAFGIPLHVKRNTFFDCPEAMDLLSLLQVLDNPLQDIPLLAVLRSPLAGLSANELARIRAGSKEKLFWNAARDFYEKKSNCSAWRKLDGFLTRFEGWRKSKTSRSLGQKLEAILADTQYMEWVTAQPRGTQRAENIQHLLRIARDFDQTRGESLYIFLRHIEELQDVVGDIEPPANSTENAVRLMTIHQSKGLEFPIVAVADLGKGINFGESKKPVLFDDQYGVCLKAQPGTRAYPTVALWLALREQQKKTMAEEMRVLYVAMTRAENRLLLFGSASASRANQNWKNWGVEKPRAQQMMLTHSMLDWIGSYLSFRSPDWAAQLNVDESGEEDDANSPFTLFAEAKKEPSENAPGNRIVQCAGGAQILFHWEAVTQGVANHLEEQKIDPDAVQKWREQLRFEYPYGRSTEVAAKTTVTALRRQGEKQDQESRPFFKSQTGDGRERGVAYHRLLQELDLSRPVDLEGLKAQAAIMVETRRLTAEALQLIELNAVARFWESEIGRDILDHKAEVRREVPFTARLSNADLQQIELIGETNIPNNEFVVVQGMADLIVLMKDGIWLVDFKTDQIARRDFEQISKNYRPQLNLYAHALAAIYTIPVTRRILYFFSAGRISEW